MADATRIEPDTGTISVTPEVLDRLAVALEYGGNTHTLEDVLDEIEAGTAQLWAEEGSILVTELDEAPRVTTLHAWLAAGNLEGVLRLGERAIEWGRGRGVTRLTLLGRPGWSRVMSRMGWEPTAVLMEREL